MERKIFAIEANLPPANNRWTGNRWMITVGPFVLTALFLWAGTTCIQACQARQDDLAPSTEESEAAAEVAGELKRADESSAEQSATIPAPLESYMGRQIAQTMHYSGAEWLIRGEREREERCSLMLANLGLKAGMTVCDMGCGNGFHTLPMAKMLGGTGQIFGVDIQPEMLSQLRDRLEEQGIGNVTPILGSQHDPRLPANAIDLILLVDVYHEFSHPEQMLSAMRRSLKPDGVVVLVEFRAEDPRVPIKPEHKMSKSQIMKELPANGFRLVKEFDGLPWQHMMFFKERR
jgi:ubiquinone/menaquinone biosynthesis C-methylase UbiE